MNSIDSSASLEPDHCGFVLQPRNIARNLLEYDVEPLQVLRAHGAHIGVDDIARRFFGDRFQKRFVERRRRVALISGRNDKYAAKSEMTVR